MYPIAKLGTKGAMKKKKKIENKVSTVTWTLEKKKISKWSAFTSKEGG